MGNGVAGAKLGTKDTTPQFVLGSKYVSADGDTYRYMQADGAVTKELFYTYDSTTWQIEDALEVAVHPADGKNKPVCVVSATLADNDFFWAMVGPGTFTANAAEALDVDDVLYGHATAGKAADTASACFLPGVTVQTAIGSATTGTFVAVDTMWAYDLP